MRALILLATVACAGATAAPSPAVAIANGKPGAFTLEAKATVKLRLVASIEALRDGKWTDVSKYADLGTGYRLVERCERKPSPPTCIELAAGAKLSPVPWTGMSCSSQCNMDCDKNAPLPAGDYRLVVTTCDGAATFAGPAFRFDGRPR